MSAPDTTTPNAKLTLIGADRKNWTEAMNRNLSTIDALIASYFVVQNLQGIWQNSTAYTTGQAVIDSDSAVVYQALIDNTSSAIPTTFLEERTAHPTYWGVYSSPARARGAWEPSTVYALNDFVVSGNQFAICVQANTSGATFAGDVALGYWSILIDLSSVGSSVLPVPGGSGDANKFVVMNGLGTGYTIVLPDAALTLLGATSVGKAVLQASTAAVARSAIGAQVAGSYQPLATSLTTLAAFTIGAFADELLACTDAGAVRTVLGLHTLATLSPGAGIATFLTTPSSANLASALTDETGSGVNVFNDSPNFTGTPTVDNHPIHYGLNPQAYATVSGGIVTEVKYVGITSIVRNSQGKYTVTMSTAMPDTDYVPLISVSRDPASVNGLMVTLDSSVARTTTTFDFFVGITGIGLTDPDSINIKVFE